MKNTKRKIGYLIIIFLVTAFGFQIFNMNKSKIFTKGNIEKEIHNSATQSYSRQWIENGDFSSSENWTLSKSELGHPEDVDGTISGGNANYDVLGKLGTFSLTEIPINGAKWTDIPNPDFPQGPTSNFSDPEGLKVYHLFDDHDANQNPSVHWDRNFSMPVNVNMSDYEIISASLQVEVNATVDLDVDVDGDTIATDGGASLNQQESYDYVRYYILISDLSKSKVWEMAYLQPNNLGQGNPPGVTNDTLPNTYLTNYPEDELIFFITSVLSTDYSNFTLTLGVRIYTADNSDTYDNDEFHEILIKSVNFNFTYERKIDQLTSISWNQEGDKPNDVSSDTVVVNEAILNFRYMINDTWTSSSQNSEIQILINGFTHTEAINLWDDAKTFFQDAWSGGFDVTYLIEEDKNINLSIQVYLADNFELNRTIKISIDNVSLDISYNTIFADYQTKLQLFLNGENKTLSPSTVLPIGKNLTITVKYTDQTGIHMPGAEIQLTGVGIIENLKEYANNYSITLNATQKLSMGVNYLEIEAIKTNHETKNINPTINIRKITGEIKTVSGESTINIDVGENVQLEIMLNDTDNNELIKGAIVTYIWNLDSIPRVLTENNGIYGGEIENPPDGLYTITVSVFAGEIYEFEDITLTLNVVAPTPGTQPDLGWLIYVLIGAIVGLVVIFTLYQTHFKFPPMVRKIRKLKKIVRKSKKSKPILVNKRDEIINSNFQDRITILAIESIQPEKDAMIEKISINKEEEV